MALFMDSHAIDGGVKAADVAQAHLADLQTQDRYGVRYLRYWVDETTGRPSAWSTRPMLRPRIECIARPTARSD
jgi:hypothetical protein